MVAQKGPPTQKTLLSFFKPKPAGEAPPPGPTPSAPPSSTPLHASAATATARPPKRKDSSTNSPSQRPASRRKTDNNTSRSRPPAQDHEPVDPADPADSEDSLFPSGLSTELARFAHAVSDQHSPTDNAMQLDSEQEPEPTPAALPQTKTTKKPLSADTLLGYRYSASGVDQGSEGSSTTELQMAQLTLREKFIKKLGNLQAPEAVASPTASEPTTARRRRLIIEDSDEEEQVATKGNPNSRAPSTQETPSQSASKAAASSRSTSSKKATKSIYTPLEKQYLEIKEQYPDTVLCIEVGYKYRFFGHDAEVASRELSIAHFLDHNFYTASIPIHRLDVHVRRLVHSGHKVGVVRQMETAALKSAGDNKSAPFTRKLTNLYTKATFLESLDQDGEHFQGSFVGREPSSQYLMCLYEQPQGGTGADEKVKVAMIAVQPATGDIIYDEFVDGHFRNELETRLLHIQPAELIVPMEPMSKATEKLLGYLTASSRRQGSSVSRSDDVRIERTEGFVKHDKAFTIVSEFYSESLKEEQFQLRNQGQDAGSSSTKHSQMEALLKTVLGLSRNLIVALAAIITHLTDFGLAPVFRLSKYFECFTSRSHMLLNGNTISNLEIFRNQTDWTAQGSLFAILDHTATGFGRRLLKKWVGKPLVDRKALQERVDAVEEILALAGKNETLEKTRGILKGLMDLEKGVCRIHYGKSSPKEFLAILQTFALVSEAIPPANTPGQPRNFGLSSPILQTLVGSLSHAVEDSRYFLNGMNKHAASKDDKLLMFQDDLIAEKWPEILDHRNSIVETEAELATHLISIRKLLREPKLEFTSVSGIDFLVEVKNKDVAKVPKSWVKISGTKQVSRFHTPEAIQLIQSKAQNQERLVLACDRAFTAFQHEFSERYEVFRDLVQNLAILDCLFSLSVVACLPGYVKPEYVDDDTRKDRGIVMEDDNEDDHDATPLGAQKLASGTTIDIKNGRHPMVEQILPAGNFVANDIHFGAEEKAILLTGPNMGGKSCYIRQVALLCIMAQIGSYLPADSARVSLLDAVYTRMGASDNIFGHESTFMVELQETSDILKMATPRSLVILDELGRGTSTHDGVAIAYAVLSHVVANIRATTLFVTHYPSLAEVAKEFPEGRIKNYHMGFMASSSSSSPSSSSAMEVDGDEAVLDEMDIVFLYKLVPGVSMKSYGLNVARMAKLPMSLIANARTKSKELERILEQRGEDRRQRQNRALLLDADSGARASMQQLKEDASFDTLEEKEKEKEEHRTVLCSRLQRILQCTTGDQALEIFQELQPSHA
ncbi:Mismatch repair protein msh3 [Mortierella alpina]|uniref:DNA mismatch repair protein MSH3 n=1 Tax=Mortierella alpina TaxID=64518 RepID=A0A9P6LVX9_MORAP|nr:Mismatch repair protein msh3 [Mortierella alpina]